jgi:N-acetylneuraminic acid mutarotase
MPISHRLPKILLRALLSLSAIFALSIPLLLTACGGSASSTPGAAQGKWTWMSGSNATGANGMDQPGVYGTMGVAAAGNDPGGRAGSVSWTDNSGNFWLFGGCGDDSTGTFGDLNDLWAFNPTTKEWMWMGGSSTVGSNGGQPGVYGTEGTAAASNVPGGRNSSVSWIDSSDNLWLFGGYGDDSTGAIGNLNDLWAFNPTTKEWTWMGGSNTTTANGNGQPGAYGTLGVAAAGNDPGGRNSSVSWIDSSGHLWLFGGFGADSTGMAGHLNDLWEFNPTTKEWTWMSGSSTVPSVDGGQPGVYGTEGTAAASNVPGGRNSSVSWIDSSGNLWLFGGYGIDSTGASGHLNDLWEFNPTTKEWTWMSGSSTVPSANGGPPSGQSGVYGTEGTAAASNVPGGRLGSVSWIDSGNFWLFGGEGYGSTGTPGYLNDLWEFNPTSKMWTWMSGSNAASTNANPNPGVYGTEGTAAASNVPGGRAASVSWADSSGNLWLFGGMDGTGSIVTQGDNLNDLWRYQP